MKILMAPSKEMDLTNLEKISNTINFEQVKENIKYIKSISQADSFVVFKSKEDIYQMHQQINQLSKPALFLFSGIAFRQLKKDKLEKYQDLYILNALYGLSKASDLISPFRFDYTMKGSKTYRKEIYAQINELLKAEDVIYNLASNEFAQGIKHPNLVTFSFLELKDGNYKQKSVDAKKMRGSLCEYLCSGNQDLENFSAFEYSFNQELSEKNYLVYTKNAD